MKKSKTERSMGIWFCYFIILLLSMLCVFPITVNAEGKSEVAKRVAAVQKEYPNNSKFNGWVSVRGESGGGCNGLVMYTTLKVFHNAYTPGCSTYKHIGKSASAKNTQALKNIFKKAKVGDVVRFRNGYTDAHFAIILSVSNREGKDNGCITNTVTQVASDPLTISVAVNKANLTCEMIQETKKFTISVLSETAVFDTFKHFGFQSGRDVDKFAGYSDCKRVANGTMAVTAGTNAYISVDVTSQVDLGSHILFLGTPTDGEILSDVPSATYAYYFANIKPKPEKVGETADGQTVWRCKICGYEYVGEELPDDFICPLCKHPASDFEKVVKN